MSETLASKLAETTALISREKVTTFVLYDGSIVKLKNTINSLLKQTYIYQDVVIVANGNEIVNEIQEYIQEIDSDICFCIVDKFKDAIGEVTSKYIQFLDSGVVLSSNKIFDEVVFLEKHNFVTIVSAITGYGSVKFSQKKITEIREGQILAFSIIDKDIANISDAQLRNLMYSSIFRTNMFDSVGDLLCILDNAISACDFWRYVVEIEKYKKHGILYVIEEVMVDVSKINK